MALARSPRARHRLYAVADAIEEKDEIVRVESRDNGKTFFGGFGQSGLGREQGIEAIGEYTQTKNVNVNLE